MAVADSKIARWRLTANCASKWRTPWPRSTCRTSAGRPRGPQNATPQTKKKTGALERLPVSMRIKRQSKTCRIGRSDPGAQPGAHFPPGPLGPYFFFAAAFFAGAFFAGAFFAGAFFAAALAIFILPLQSRFSALMSESARTQKSFAYSTEMLTTKKNSALKKQRIQCRLLRQILKIAQLHELSGEHSPAHAIDSPTSARGLGSKLEHAGLSCGESGEATTKVRSDLRRHRYTRAGGACPLRPRERRPIRRLRTGNGQAQ